MSIGIAAESSEDVYILRSLLNNYLSTKQHKIHIYKENQLINRTQIRPKDLNNIAEYFKEERVHPIKFIVILTDRDGQLDLKNKLNNYYSVFPLPIIFAIPQEIIEDWLTTDLSIIKKLFKEVKTFSKHKSVNSKVWLSQLIGQFKLGSYLDVSLKIAKNVDTTKIKLGFDELVSDLKPFIQDNYVAIEQKPRSTISKKVKRQLKYTSKIHPLRSKDRRINK